MNHDERNRRVLASRPRLLPPKDDMAAIEDERIRDAVNEEDDPLSNCCGLPFLDNTDFCKGCKEHAAAEIEVNVGKDPWGDGSLYRAVTFDPVGREVIEVGEIYD